MFEEQAQWYERLADVIIFEWITHDGSSKLVSPAFRDTLKCYRSRENDQALGRDLSPSQHIVKANEASFVADPFG